MHLIFPANSVSCGCDIVSAPKYGWTWIKSEDVRSQKPVPILAKDHKVKDSLLGKLPRSQKIVQNFRKLPKPGMTG